MDAKEYEQSVKSLEQSWRAREKNLQKRITNQRFEIKVLKRKQKKHLKIIKNFELKTGGNNV